jgi:hypothetical protein
MSRVLSVRLPLAVAALVFGSGALQAASKLSLTYSATTLWCSTVQGVGPTINVTVKPVTTLTPGAAW